MGVSTNSTALGTIGRNAIRRYPVAAMKLPEPDEEWLRIDIELDEGALKAFNAAGVIHKTHRDTEWESRHYWQTSRDAIQYIQQRYQDTDTTPCGNATGIRTLEPGRYTCTCDDCECRMDRKTALEVVDA